MMRNDIQTLRAIAVLAVAVCHMNPAWLPGGYLGVDMFFVISGFVITKMLFESQLESSQLLNFWIRRIFRIIPAYAFMLAITGPIAALLLLPEDFSQFSKSWVKSLNFVSNQYYAEYGDYFSPKMAEQPLLHTWSLSVEMQFYLIYPLFLILALRANFPSVFILITIFSYLIAQSNWINSESQSILYYSLLIRAPEFLMGCTLSVYTIKFNYKLPAKFKTPLAFLGFVMLISSFILIDEKIFSPILSTIICTGTFLIILSDLQNEKKLAFILNSKIFVYLGGLSYSIYLYHWPILAQIRYSYGEIQWTIWSIILFIAVTFFVSWLSWKFIENYFKYINSASIFKNSSKLLFVVIVAISPVSYAKNLNSIIPAQAIEYTRYADDKTICHGKKIDSCLRGNSLRPKILLIGDSHAAQLNIAADVAGENLGIGIELISGSSCIPLEGFNINKLPDWARKSCQDQIDLVSRKLPEYKIIILAGMWSYQLQDELMPNLLHSFFIKSTLNNQQVIVLGQIPKLKRDPVRLLRLKYLGIELPATLDSDWIDANQKLEILTKTQNIKFYHVENFAMFNYPPYFKGEFIYRDNHHLNEVGSRKYGQYFANLINDFSSSN